MNPFFKGNGPANMSQSALNPQAVNTVKGMLQNLRSVQNPEAVINTLASKNPLLGSVMRMVGGRDPKQVFFEECQRQGIDPNEIINMLR